MSARTEAADQPGIEWIRAECERRFQNGGPRVYVCDSSGRLTPSGMSGARAARCAAAGESVYARKRAAGRYEWTRVHPRTAAPCAADLFFKREPEPEACDVLGDVLAELRKAMVKFPTWPTDPLHALAVLGEEFGELTKDVLQLTYEPHKTSAANVRTEAIQTAAMALRFAISLHRYAYRAGAQHAQAAVGTGAHASTEVAP